MIGVVVLVVIGQVIALDALNFVNCYSVCQDRGCYEAKLDFTKDIRFAEQRRIGGIDAVGSEAELLEQKSRRMVVVVDLGDEKLNTEIDGGVMHEEAKRFASAAGAARVRIGDHDRDFGMTGVKVRMEIEIDITEQQRWIVAISDNESEFGRIEQPRALIEELLVQRERFRSSETKNLGIRHPCVIGGDVLTHVRHKKNTRATQRSVLIQTHN